MYKMIILPRQTQDKNKENSKKEMRFSQAYYDTVTRRGLYMSNNDQARTSKTVCSLNRLANPDRFATTGSGRPHGKLKTSVCFFARANQEGYVKGTYLEVLLDQTLGYEVVQVRSKRLRLCATLY
jgi:hypothetical protein